MRQLLFSFCLSIFALTLLPAQSGCPGCMVDLPASLPEDTLYLPPLPDGEKGTPYDEEISFRIPKSTTPVNAVDSTTPPGLPISKIEILGIDGLPVGMSWEASQLEFDTDTETDGCFRICGTPFSSDSFVMTVRLKATIVFPIVQEASFPLRLYIAPKTSMTDGFTMTNTEGCGSTTVSFTNNIPSNGNPGFSYEWDFGDSTNYSGEDPPPHTYDEAGLYEVNYQATIDTVGDLLVSATILSVGCTDLINSPDIYMFIKDPNGNEIYNSSPHINNATLPLTFPIEILLDETSNYSLEVWDEDSGLKGSDDPCGSVPFNILSGDTLVSGDFTVILNIEHPIEEIFSTDTVQVFPAPLPPILSANTLAACSGSDTIVLESSYGGGNQWFIDGEAIAGATDFLYMPDSSGYYQVQVTNFFGCPAISDSSFIEFYALPAIPAYMNDRNNLELEDTTALPTNYSLQWYLFAAPIAGATGFDHCAIVDGDYSLVVTDLNTGCTSSYMSSVTVDPTYDCTLSAKDLAVETLIVFPNPATDWVTIQLDKQLSQNSTLNVWDVAGRLAQRIEVESGRSQLQLDSNLLNPGMYFLELNLKGQRYVGQLIVLQ